MSEESHLKCSCQLCGGPIEFPASGAGSIVSCPHCGGETQLSVPIPEAPAGVSDDFAADAVSDTDYPKTRSGGRRWVWIALSAGLVATGGLLLFFKERPGIQMDTASSNATTAIAEPVRTDPPAAPPAEKSVADFKVGSITLEKTRGSSLVYAIGVLKNESPYQRFGIHVELELIDNLGNRLGTSKDYRAVLEPRQEWRFRALVLDSKTVSAKVIAIREE